jgi:2-polyprenyl-6-methoxyphenol hydroxylase-like FAD-dependent oxidoreductase
MSPFSGAGANLAMKDGAGLVKELAREKAQAELKNRVGDQEWVRNAIQRHEEKMMGRARRELRVSNFAMGVVISPNAERNVRRVAPVAKGIYAAITAAMRLKAAVKRQ